MAYIRVKWIKGNPYLYEQESYRVGKKVKTRHIRYIGKFGYSSASGGFPGDSTVDPSRRKAITTEIEKLEYRNSNPYERSILQTYLEQNDFSFRVGDNDPDLTSATGYVAVQRRSRKVTEFALCVSSTPTTWMHETGHALELQDQLVDEEIEELRQEFIDSVKADYERAVEGSMKEIEGFVQKYGHLINLRLELQSRYDKKYAQHIDKISDLLERAKDGRIPETALKSQFRSWVRPDYRLKKEEVFADVVASLIIDAKTAFESHGKAGRKFLTRTYVKLYTHLENEYSMSLGKPKEE